MNINISGDNIELTPEIQDYATKKMEALSKFMGNPDNVLVHVIIGRTTYHHQTGDIFQTSITLNSGKQFHAQSTNQDVFASIDVAQEEMTRELTSYKDKRQVLWKRGALSVKNALKGLGGFKRYAKKMRFKKAD